VERVSRETLGTLAMRQAREGGRRSVASQSMSVAHFVGWEIQFCARPGVLASAFTSGFTAAARLHGLKSSKVWVMTSSVIRGFRVITKFLPLEPHFRVRFARSFQACSAGRTVIE
jgi:hypothetical protein